jgi:hypothetical protein
VVIGAGLDGTEVGTTLLLVLDVDDEVQAAAARSAAMARIPSRRMVRLDATPIGRSVRAGRGR